MSACAARAVSILLARLLFDEPLGWRAGVALLYHGRDLPAPQGAGPRDRP